MAHLMVKKELLKELRGRLNHNPIGLPEDVHVYEILSILFTNEEAMLASMFPRAGIPGATGSYYKNIGC